VVRRRRRRGRRTAEAWISCTTRWRMAGRSGSSPWSISGAASVQSEKPLPACLGAPSVTSLIRHSQPGPRRGRSLSITAPSSCRAPSRTGPSRVACSSIHSPRHTRGKCRHRGVQRPTARRVFERAPIHVDRRCTGEGRSLARRLQSAPAAQLARAPDTERVRRPTSGATNRR